MNRFNWDTENESYARLDYSVTGLNVNIWVDEQSAYIDYEHPFLVIIQNSYDMFEWKAKLPIYVDDHNIPHNIYDIKPKIKKSDYIETLIWIQKHAKRLKELADMKIEVFKFIDLIREDDKVVLQESLEKTPLNEMSVIGKEYTGLSFGIWIDDGERYKSTGHYARLKIQGPDKSKKTTSWIPVDFEGNFFKSSEKEAEKYKAKDLEKIRKFLDANKELIYNVSFGIISIDDFKRQVLDLDDIKNNVTLKTRDEKIERIVFKCFIQPDNKYCIMHNLDRDKVIVKNTYTDEYIGQWTSIIIPKSEDDANGEYVNAYDDDYNSFKIYLTRYD